MTLSRSALLALVSIPLLSPSALAQAVDGEAFADDLQAAMEELGAPLRHGAVQTDGNNVTISDVRVGAPDSEDLVGEVRFEGVSGSEAEGWRVERAALDDYTSTEGEYTTSASGILFTGVVVPASAPSGAPAPAGAPGAPGLWSEGASVEQMSVTEGGQEVFWLEDATSTTQRTGDQGFQSDFSVAAFRLTPTASGDMRNTLREIGYEQLTGRVEGSGAWMLDSGDVSVSPLRLVVDDAATFDFTYAMSGYTPAFLQQLTALQAQMVANPEAQSGAGMAMLGLVSQLSLRSVEIGVEDQSLTNRLLDYYAEENGTDRATMIDQLVGSLPALLGGLNNPEFQAEVSEAVETFLRDPQSIRAAIAPAQPIPATQIMGAAMGAPQTLPTVLNLSVTAND